MRITSELVRKINTKEQLEELYNEVDIQDLNYIKSKEELTNYIIELRNIITVDHIDIEEVYGIYNPFSMEKMNSLIEELLSDLEKFKEITSEDNVEDIKRLLSLDFSTYYYTYINYYDNNSERQEETFDDSNRQLFRDFINDRIKELSAMDKKTYVKENKNNN